MVKMNKPILEAKNINKTFNKKPCLDGISLNIYKGEFLVIAGSNGSGKTLLMKHLNGIYPIKKGTIKFMGEDCYKKDNLMKSRIGLVFQNPDTQIVSLRVEEDVSFGPMNLGLSKEDVECVTDDALNRLQIEHLRDRNPHTLSGGEMKRVTIAGIIAMNPHIIIFDEPFIGLDYQGVISVTEALIDLHKKGETVVVITHDLEKVLKYAERMVVMENGKVVFNGTPTDSLEKLESWGIRRPIQEKVEDMSWIK